MKASTLGRTSWQNGAADATGLKEAVREAERRAVVRAWTESGGNVSRASRLLGVSRPTLYRLLREHGLK